MPPGEKGTIAREKSSEDGNGGGGGATASVDGNVVRRSGRGVKAREAVYKSDPNCSQRERIEDDDSAGSAIGRSVFDAATR